MKMICKTIVVLTLDQHISSSHTGLHDLVILIYMHIKQGRLNVIKSGVDFEVNEPLFSCLIINSLAFNLVLSILI